jgi:hypothetical protein
MARNWTINLSEEALTDQITDQIEQAKVREIAALYPPDQ